MMPQMGPPPGMMMQMPNMPQFPNMANLPLNMMQGMPQQMPATLTSTSPPVQPQVAATTAAATPPTTTAKQTVDVKGSDWHDDEDSDEEVLNDDATAQKNQHDDG